MANPRCRAAWTAALVVLLGLMLPTGPGAAWAQEATGASLQTPLGTVQAAPAAGDAARELDRLKQEIQLLQAKSEAQDKRFDVQTTQLDRTVGWFQTFLTVLTFLLALAGVGTYFSVQNKAKSEAEEAAGEWFDDRAGNLDG